MAEMIRAKKKKATLSYSRGRHPRTLCVLSRDGRDGGTQYKPAPAAGHSKMVCVVGAGAVPYGAHPRALGFLFNPAFAKEEKKGK